MDPRQVIRLAVADQMYLISRHALDEADKDSISQDMIERVMCFGIRRKI